MSSTALISTRNIAMDGIGLACDRRLDGRLARTPDGTILVSADNHWSLAEDPWKDRVPLNMRDRVPSVWWDEELKIWNMGIGGKPIFTGALAHIIKSIEDRPGSSSMKERMADHDAEGLAMEIVFPQSLLIFFQHPDFEAREWLFSAYNEYLVELNQRAPSRFFGVGFINFWDPAKMADSVRRVRDLGLKTFMLPINPGKNIDGKPIHYASEEMDPLWAAVEETGLPVYFHVGENLNVEGPGGVAGNTFSIFMPFRKNFGELVFGGVFDRHPNLRIAFAEAGINWIPGMLQDAEMVVDSFSTLLNPQLKLRPTDYWRRNCYATFMADSIGLKMIDYVGADRIMWAPDYPHHEGTLGYTAAVIDEIVSSVSAADARKILGGTAIELFDLI